MTALLALLKAHPELVEALLEDLVTVGKLDPTLWADALGAYESKQWGPFALAHITAVVTLASRLQGSPELAAAIAAALRA